MLTGSTGTRINTTRMIYRNDLPISRIADSIATSSRPHDPNSAGVVGGEGASSVVMETSQHAADRGGRAIAVLAGSASRFVASDAIRNGQRSSRTNPPQSRGSCEAIALAIEGAVAQASRDDGYTAADIGAIISHGAGDPSTDAAEQQALQRTLPDTPVVAPIASIGHTGAASGGIAIATAAMMIDKGLIPPTLNAETATAVNVSAQPRELTKRCVLCIAHTSEGSATAILLAKP
jgi:3-oxoacyl-(acyl-carrier-protein) synthase